MPEKAIDLGDAHIFNKILEHSTSVVNCCYCMFVVFSASLFVRLCSITQCQWPQLDGLWLKLFALMIFKRDDDLGGQLTSHEDKIIPIYHLSLQSTRGYRMIFLFPRHWADIFPFPLLCRYFFFRLFVWLGIGQAILGQRTKPALIPKLANWSPQSLRTMPQS